MTRQEIFTWVQQQYGTEPELDDAIKSLLALSFDLTTSKKRK